MSANPLGDFFAEIGKITLFLLTKYYELMRFVQGSMVAVTGEAASFLVVALLFIVVPLIVLVQLLSSAVSSTYAVFEWSWNGLVRILLLVIVTFLILYAVK